jgi:hypothetical protein
MNVIYWQAEGHRFIRLRLSSKQNSDRLASHCEALGGGSPVLPTGTNNEVPNQPHSCPRGLNETKVRAYRLAAPT